MSCCGPSTTEAFVPHRISRDRTVRRIRRHAGACDPLDLERRSTRRRSAGQSQRPLAAEGSTRFARVAEIIDADPERRRLGRERFKAYRDRKIAARDPSAAPMGC